MKRLLEMLFQKVNVKNVEYLAAFLISLNNAISLQDVSSHQNYNEVF